MISKIKHFMVRRRAEILIIAINLITFHKWFFSFSSLAIGDWQYRVPAMCKEALSTPFIWDNASTAFGSTSAVPMAYPVTVLEGLVARLGFGSPVIERVCYMWPIVIVGALSSYYLVKRITKAELPAFVGSIVYTLNTYFLFIATGHLPVLVTVALAPLIILFFLRTLEEKKFYLAILTGIFSWIAGSYDMRIFFIISWVLFLYFVYHTFVIEKPNVKLIMKNSFLAATPIAILFLTNLYWILGFWSSRGYGNPIYNRGLWGNEFLNIRYAATLFHPFWLNWEHPVRFFPVPQKIPIYFYIIPVVALLGLILRRKNKQIVFFGGISILGILLVKQAGGPFPGLYNWLYDHIPGFSLFREASKFYFLIILGYSVLIAGFVGWLSEKWSSGRWKILGKYLIIAFIIFAFVFNAVPLITGEIRGLFVSKEVPSDYILLHDYILRQEGPFRMLWVPRFSQYSIHTRDKHAITCDGVTDTPNNKGGWSDIVGSVQHSSDWQNYERLTDFFKRGFSEDLLGGAAIKYVIVPVRDAKNKDDFFSYYKCKRSFFINELDKLDYLKRVDIGTKELVLYEYKNFKPYVDCLGNLYCLNTLSNLDNKSRFVRGALGTRFGFVLGSTGGYGSLTGLINIFEGIIANDISSTSSSVKDGVSVGNNGKIQRAYKNKNRERITYEEKGGRLEIYSRKPSDLLLNGNPVDFRSVTSDHLLQSIAIRPDRDYYYIVGNALFPIKPGTQGTIGTLDGNQKLRVYSSQKRSNLIANGSFEQGFWQEEVGDYHNYDKNPILGMRLNKEEKTDGGQSLQLEAARHIAGTYQAGIQVKAGAEYLLSLDYQSPNAEIAEYRIDFNDRRGTHIEETLPVKDKKWHTFSKTLRIPSGASSLILTLIGFSKEDKTRIITRYDNTSLVELDSLMEYVPGSSGGFDSTELQMRTGHDVFKYIDPGSFANIVPNGSFEQGFWQEEVGDYHNYDKNPILGMRLNKEEKTDGGQSLQLEAARHIAGTYQAGIQVKAGAEYLLSLDYQSPNAEMAEYRIDFNDRRRTQIKETLPVKDKKWHTFSKTLRIPSGASSLSLTLIGFSKEDKTRIITRYDDVRLVELPPFINWFYYVNAPKEGLTIPKDVEFKSVNYAKKSIHIRSAKTAFFLTMSESYHPGWKLLVDDKKINGPLKSWIPFVQPNEIGENEHYKLDTNLNVWYVDPVQLKRQNLAKENSDGTFDIDLVAEFWPQRYCYLGALISLLTLLACFVFLIVDWRRRRTASMTGKT